MTYIIFHDSPGLENGLTKFRDFPWLEAPWWHSISSVNKAAIPCWVFCQISPRAVAVSRAQLPSVLPAIVVPPPHDACALAPLPPTSTWTARDSAGATRLRHCLGRLQQCSYCPVSAKTHLNVNITLYNCKHTNVSMTTITREL